MATYDNEWIVRYVDGELSPEETGQFEDAMRSDHGLAAEVGRYRELKALLDQRLPDDPVLESLTQRTARLNEQYFAQRPSGSATLRWISTVAAAACIITVIIVSWPADTSRKLDQLGQTDMIGMTERGDRTDTLLQKAAAWFNQRHFDKALPLLNQAVIADTASQLALFYRGITAWHTGDLPLARKSLQQVYEKGSVLQTQAAFYMALTYAGEHNDKIALDWLQKIPETDPEHLKASELEKLIK